MIRNTAPMQPIGSKLQPFLRAASFSDGLTCRQVAILASIFANPNKSVKDHAEACNVSKPAITRATDKMLEMGWITRDHDPQDRRQVLLTITDRGAINLAWSAGI